ncbi:MAG: iron-sulfur cluster assembly scaffold protein, partial [Alkalispirochaeta sp.]
MSDQTLRETLLSYSRSPRNGDLRDEYTHRSVVTNPGCGDRIEIRFLVDSGVIREASYHSRGCALSTASAAILDETVPGWPVDRLRETADAAINGELPAELAVFESIRGNPAR